MLASETKEAQSRQAPACTPVAWPMDDHHALCKASCTPSTATHVQAHCERTDISLAPVPGKTLADLMRMVVLLQQRASGPAADEDQDADEALSVEGMLQFAESVLGLC